MSKWIVTAVVVAAVAAGGGWLLFGQNGSATPASVRFRTAKVERGEIVEGVQASGTVQPVILVQVGTQVSGVIEKLLVDFNSKVKAGQTIAVLDMRRLESQVAQDVASVARAKADVERVRATVVEAKSELRRTQAASGQVAADVDRVNALLTQAERNLERQTALAERKLISASDLDAAVASRSSLQAQLASAKASVELNAAQVTSAESAIKQNEAQSLVAEAAVKQAEAQEQGDRVNLGYATIVSPIDGVVVSRNVDVGQTVAASLSAPTLFVIANDLTRIQIQTSVPEADIGRLHDGQKVVFNVDAHPDKSFDGMVSQVRLASTTVQNVVTYTVLVEASNPDGLLLPGMTANVTFEIQRSAKDAMTVPASALRLQTTPDLLESPEQPAAAADAPAADAPAADAPRKDGTGAGDGKPPGGPGQGGPRRGKGAGKRTRGVVYLQTPAGKLRAVPVKLGISDGIRTVVEVADAAALAEGAEVVTAVMRDEGPATTNPFAPPRMSTSTRTPGAR
jgi:HlyD family secretion protein